MPRLFVELTDLLAHFRGYRAPMGVARVQMALLEAGVAGVAEQGSPPLFIPVAHSPEAGGLRCLPPRMLRRLMQSARAGGPLDEPEWLALQDAAAAELAEAPVPDFAPGDRVACLGHATEAALRRLRGLRASHGILICVLFYDAIPLTVPEHCEPELTQGFAAQFVALCLQLDRVLAISEEAARDFRRWQRRVLPGFDIPVGVVPLDAPFPAAPPTSLPSPLAEDEPYVLCVATLESRKNHVLLLHAWLTLLRRHGAEVMPRLVLVGRRGYGAEAALRLLEHAPELRRKVLWLRELGDGALAALYAKCLFTIFNSFHEGWGLPVTEALAHGKLVLAPDHTSLREAGGSAALYFTGQSEPELADLIWDLLREPERRAALEAGLPARALLRSWREVAEELAARFLAEAPALPQRQAMPIGSRVACTPPPSCLLPDLPSPATMLGQVMREGEAWGAQEGNGVWMMAGEARLRLPLEAALLQPLLLLEVAAPPVSVRLRLRTLPMGIWHELELAPSEQRCVEVLLPPVGPGDLMIEFDTAAHMRPAGETRDLHAMLSGLMLCEADDLAARLRYLEGRLKLRRAEPEPGRMTVD